MMYPKNKTYRSNVAIRWFRGRPCRICGNHETTGHHEPLNGRGMGLKGPDDEQVPLCFRCHRARHDMGRECFWIAHGLEWNAVVEDYKEMFHEFVDK